MQSKGTILIPDISGYTRFLTRTELSHSTHIINELLQTMMDANGEEFSLIEIEGDALLLFREGEPLDHKQLNKHCRRIFGKFHEYLKIIERDRICHCGACAGATNLNLKFVAHFGQVNTIKLGPMTKPTGVELIVAHRLLKNDIDSDSYMLFTTNLVEECKSEDCPDPWKVGSAEYAEIGNVNFEFLLLDDVKSQIPDAPKSEVPEMTYQGEIPFIEIDAPFQFICTRILDNKTKEIWVDHVKGVTVETELERIGNKHICVLESATVELENIAAASHEDNVKYVQKGVVKENGFRFLNFWEVIKLEDKKSKIVSGIGPVGEDEFPPEVYDQFLGDRWIDLKAFKEYAENEYSATS